MTIKVKRTGTPPELETAVGAYAAALAAGDERGAAALVDGRAAEAASVVHARAASMRLTGRIEVIARARLGMQYIVKLRLTGAAGAAMTLQSRWHREDGGAWRLIEIEDAGLRSPWKKPEGSAPAKGGAVRADG
jgi:hypothetical protein